MSEMQKPVLEHSASEARQEEMTRIPFVYEVDAKALDDPDLIKGVAIVLPSGLRARFIRSGGWVSVNP